MHRIQKHIEIVRTSLSGLSSMSIDSANGVRKVLKHSYAKVGITTITTREELDRLVLSKPDLVFLGMKQLITATDSIWLADFLDDFDIPYTGSKQSAHMLELDKSLAKRCSIDAGLNTSPFFVAVQGTEVTETDIPFPYPVFIKPTDGGGGKGVDDSSVARNFAQLQAKVQSISTNCDADSLIEVYLNGREFSVAVLKEANSDGYMAMPLELIAPANDQGDRLLSSAIKAADTETFIGVSAGNLREAISELALGAYHALGARDYGRIDIRLDSNGTPHFLEANLMPSVLKDYGNFPKACLLNNGIDYEEAILRIVHLAFARTAETIPADETLPVLLTPEPLPL